METKYLVIFAVFYHCASIVVGVPAPHLRDFGRNDPINMCPPKESIPYMKDFNLEQMLGSWFVYAKTRVDHTTCLVDIFFKNDENNYHIQSRRLVKGPDGFNLEWKDDRKVGSGSDGGAMSVALSGITSAVLNHQGNYYVLDTDYENYATIFECEDASMVVVAGRAYSGSILVKSLAWAEENQNIIEEQRQKIFGIDSNGISWSNPERDLSVVSHEGCDINVFSWTIPDVSGLLNRGIDEIIKLFNNEGGIVVPENPDDAETFNGSPQPLPNPSTPVDPSNGNPSFNPSKPEVSDNEVNI
ncbi:unnamed protein product [Cyprideis torosa]|uniref:Uncharacterized protein n=1 Tax=Cyprideis torosa TaxID=163714 RepID=A0A7R8ZIK7_9CRUS|nr:unnamed protein product [Cyprideis torosa]CAG0884974.1 unnamed protein product [Cyprideis torosa]